MHQSHGHKGVAEPPDCAVQTHFCFVCLTLFMVRSRTNCIPKVHRPRCAAGASNEGLCFIWFAETARLIKYLWWFLLPWSMLLASCFLLWSTSASPRLGRCTLFGSFWFVQQQYISLHPMCTSCTKAPQYPTTAGGTYKFLTHPFRGSSFGTTKRVLETDHTFYVQFAETQGKITNSIFFHETGW